MIPDMPDSPAHARTEPRGWTVPQGFLAALLVILGTGITVVAFRVIWSTVTDVVRPSMHRQAWTVPVACEIAFVFMFLLGVLLAWRKAPPVASRGLIMAGLIAGSVELNVYASRGNVPALVAHLVVTGAFYSCLLAGKAAITAIKGGKIRADRIAGMEWLLHPARSAALSWWMHSWGEPSRDAAHARYRVLLFARTIAQADERIGRAPWLWKRHLPPSLRYEFSLGDLPLSAPQEGWMETIRLHVTEQLRLQFGDTDGRSASDTGGGSQGDSGRDINGGTGSDRDERNPGDTERDSWPETKDVDPAVLARMVRTAIGRYERANEGRRVPDMQLESLIKVRMSRVTAKKLLTAAYASSKRETMSR